MFAKLDSTEASGLPPWVQGVLSPSAFQALKEVQAERQGFIGKPATMRKLEGKGLVRQIEGGAYVLTAAGRDLIEGCSTCPPEYDFREPSLERPSPGRSKEAAEGERAPAGRAKAYTVEEAEGGCRIYRLASPARRVIARRAPA